MHRARQRARIGWTVMLLCAGVSAYAVREHVVTILKPRALVAQEKSGWLFSGTPSRFELSPAATQETWKQIVEAHFARTEKGGFPGIENYSSTAAAAQMKQLLERSTATAFMISLAVTEGRLQKQVGNMAEFHVRGRLTVAEKSETAVSEVFLATVFVRGAPTTENPSGWRMSGLNEIDRNVFFAREREQVQESIFGEAKDPAK
jgi:hypothetical protein